MEAELFTEEDVKTSKRGDTGGDKKKDTGGDKKKVTEDIDNDNVYPQDHILSGVCSICKEWTIRLTIHNDQEREDTLRQIGNAQSQIEHGATHEEIVTSRKGCKGHQSNLVTTLTRKKRKKKEEKKAEFIRETLSELTDKWNVSFDELKGLDEEIQHLKFLVESNIVAKEEKLRSKKYKIDRGVILIGKPGVAKTPLMKSLILYCTKLYPDHIGYNWVALREIITGNDVGINANNIHDIFTNIRLEAADQTLVTYFVVLDDLEIVMKDRTEGTGANQQTIPSVIIAELDDLPDNIIILAASNLIKIDDAIIKRIGPVFLIPLPNLEARKEIIILTCRDMDINNVDIDKIAEKTDGFTGHDIVTMLTYFFIKKKIDLKKSGKDTTKVCATTEEIVKIVDSELHKSSGKKKRLSAFGKEDDEYKRPVGRPTKTSDEPLTTPKHITITDMIKRCLEKGNDTQKGRVQEYETYYYLYKRLTNKQLASLNEIYKVVEEEELEKKKVQQHQTGYDKDGNKIIRKEEANEQMKTVIDDAKEKVAKIKQKKEYEKVCDVCHDGFVTNDINDQWCQDCIDGYNNDAKKDKLENQQAQIPDDENPYSGIDPNDL